MARVTITLRDYDGDDFQASFQSGVTLNAANYDAEAAKGVALRDALLGITMGTQKLYALAGTYNYNGGVANANSPVAQSNIQWVVEFADTVNGSKQTMRLGTADLTIAGILKAGSNEADLTTPEMTAFIAAFENWQVSDDGNPIQVTNIYFRE